ncbi:MAG: glycosyltransferase family 4 protein [Candidatus Bathyarchaeota archaeon]|nr:glycosyltransferase family 4 protein [Candidatus Bathyarchaeota archaeon]
MTEKGKMLQGGVGQCILQLTKGLLKKGINVSIVTRAETGNFKEVLDIPIHRASYLDLGFRESKVTSIPMMFLKGFNPKNVDIVHSHNPPGALSAYPVLLKRKHPHMMTMHGPWADLRGKLQFMADPLEKFAISMADKITMDSEALRKRIETKYGLDRKTKQKITTIPNAVETGIFKPRDKTKARSRLGLPKERQIISYTGRFVEGKRIQDILHAIPRVAYDNRDALFLFIGGGHDQRLIQDWIHRNQEYRDNIKIVPFLEYDSMPYLYNASDIFVLPTLAEGLSRSLLEAMSSSTPVIATDIEANSEVVTKDTGILVPVKSPENIAGSINKILQDKKFAGKLSMNARRHILKHLSVEQRVNSFIKEYKRLV